MIQKLIHNIWLQGYKKVPDNYKKNIVNNKKILFDYKFKFWDENKIVKMFYIYFPNLLPIYKNISIYAQKSDIARYCILYLYGGIYVDIDFMFYKKIDIFLQYDFIGIIDFIFVKRKIMNALIGSCVKNKIFIDFINWIMVQKPEDFNDELKVTFITGTQTLYKIVEKNTTIGISNIKLLNRKYFFNGSIHDNTIEYNFDKEYQFGMFTNQSSWMSTLAQVPHDFVRNINNQIFEFKYNQEPLYFLSDKILKKIVHGIKKNIIVIAHPDDELLFFGEFLIVNSSESKVLCVSNASDKLRSNEFINVMERLGCDYEMWDLKDLWTYAKCDKLNEKLNNAIKGYTNIYTHSLSGETGHPVHILLNKYLFDIVPTNLFVSNPYNFNQEISKEKMNLIKLYRTQKFTIYKYLFISKREDYLLVK